MKQISVSAPGKLVLCGEYAVLQGAPAVAAAVDVRAEVKVSPAERHELIVVNHDERFEFEADTAGRINWSRDPGEFAAIVEAAAPLLTDKAVEPFSVAIDTRDFYMRNEHDELTKKGIGSSAAVAVSLAAAFQLFADDRPSLEKAMEVHTRFQQQQGSGIDVLSSWFGGLINKSGDNVTMLAWPDKLSVLPVSTGIAASTTDKLGKLNAFSESDPEGYATVSAALCEAAETASAAWQERDAEKILATLQAFAVALKDFDTATGLDIWSEPHTELAELAAKYGAVYKPSGAGGGDFGLAFTRDDAVLGSFTTELDAKGYAVARFGWSDAGIRVRNG